MLGTLEEYLKNSQYLMDRYLIQDADGNICSDDVKFITDYKRELYEIFKILDSVVNGGTNSQGEREEAVSKIFVGVVNLACSLKKYIKNMDKENVARRMTFINNIDKEIEFISENISSDDSQLFSYGIFENAMQIKYFIKYVCCSEFIEKAGIESFEDKHVKNLQGRVVSYLNANYLNFIDPDNLVEDDAYFLYGHLLNLYKKEMYSLPKACGNCEKDECMYCSSLADKVAHNELEDAYKKLCNIVYAKINGWSFNQEELKNNLKNLRDSNLAKLVSKIVLDNNLPKDDKKKIKINDLILADQLQKKELIAKINSVDASHGFMLFDCEEYAFLMLDKFMDKLRIPSIDVTAELNEWFTKFKGRLDASEHLTDIEKAEQLVFFDDLIDAYKLQPGTNTEPGGDD